MQQIIIWVSAPGGWSWTRGRFRRLFRVMIHCSASAWQWNRLKNQMMKQVLKPDKIHSETGGPNISIVSRTRERWSRKEFTDTRRMRASSACHLLKHKERNSLTGTIKCWMFKEEQNLFHTQKACCLTAWAVFLCHLSSAPYPATENAGRWQPLGMMGREHPERCKGVKDKYLTSSVSKIVHI